MKTEINKNDNKRAETLLNNIPEFLYAFKEDNKNDVIYVSPYVTGYFETNKKAETVKELLNLNKNLFKPGLSDDIKLELIDILKACSMFLTSNVQHYIKCKYKLKGGK